MIRSALALFGCLAAAHWVGLGVATAQTTPPVCSLSTLSGTYSLVLTGRDVNSAAALSRTTQGLGSAVFDGAGKVTFNLTTNTNISQGVAQTFSGAYNLGANCVGAVNLTVGDAASFILIAYNLGRNFTVTGEDGTYALTGSGGQQPSVCAASTLSGAYAFSGNGFVLALGSVSGVNSISGLLQFDGSGGMNGSWTVAVNGGSTSDSVAGQYSVTSACLGSGTVKDSSGTAYTLSFTVTSADAANFGVDIANPAAQFSANGHSTFTNPGLAVVSAASGLAGTPPGSDFSVYGSGLAAASAQPNNVPLPTTVLTTTVTVNGEAVPLFYVSSGQVNAQMPLDIQPGLATVVVKNGSVTSNAAAVMVPATAAPGIFLYGNNRAVVQNKDFSLNSATAPAHVGDVAIGYLTGGGPVQAGGPLVTGQPSPNGLSPVTEKYTVTVAGQPATVNYLGLAPTLIGVYQLNFVIPSVAAGDRQLVVNIGGTASNAALISVAN